MSFVEKSQKLVYNIEKMNIGGILMDRITQSMMEAFKADLSININDDSLLFEYFSNYCVVNNVYGLNDFDVEDITTGNSTQGIDGIAIWGKRGTPKSLGMCKQAPKSIQKQGKCIIILIEWRRKKQLTQRKHLNRWFGI